MKCSKAVSTICLTMVLIGGTGCGHKWIDPWRSNYYEELILPSEVDGDIRVRFLWCGVNDEKEQLDCVDITVGNKDYRLSWVERGGAYVEFAEDRKVVFEGTCRTRILNEQVDAGLGEVMIGGYPDWLGVDAPSPEGDLGEGPSKPWGRSGQRGC